METADEMTHDLWVMCTVLCTVLFYCQVAGMVFHSHITPYSLSSWCSIFPLSAHNSCRSLGCHLSYLASLFDVQCLVTNGFTAFT